MSAQEVPAHHGLEPLRLATADDMLVARLGPNGYPKQVHLQRTRLVTDDFGDAVGYVRRCPDCRRWKPLTIAFWTPSPGSAQGASPRCRACNPVHKRKVYWSDPEHYRAASRETYARLSADPQWSTRLRLQGRARRLRRFLADPEAERARWAEANRKRLRRQSEGQRMARRERERMDRRIRAERDGRSIGPAPDLTSTGRWVGEICIAPFVDRVIRPAMAARLWAMGIDIDWSDAEQSREALRTAATLAGGNGERAPMEYMASRLGIDPRTVGRYLSGEIVSTQADRMDGFLLAMDRLWWEVYEPGDPGYEDARRLLGDG